MTVPRGGGSRTPQSEEVKNIAILSLSSMIDEYEYLQAHAAAAKQIKAAAAAAARQAAEVMEVDTTNDVLVGALVKREIAKSTAALRKEVNQLRSALNFQAGRKTKGATGTPNKPAGAKAKGPRSDAKTKPPVKPKGNAPGNKSAVGSKQPATNKKNPPSKKSNSTDKRKAK
ncbi:hypothetical protein DYB38_007891 [Aphanomyces astaci]|uniref:Uncharacterized protein n=1 Tax=Aphanomyces astaci TaxID=112090 RepID=A0A397E918_APHAT|nr:hypothetical protein DYB38_007891 [Aphanomyces astaci]